MATITNINCRTNIKIKIKIKIIHLITNIYTQASSAGPLWLLCWSFRVTLWVLGGSVMCPRRGLWESYAGTLWVLGGNLVFRVSLFSALGGRKKRDPGNKVAQAGPLWVLGRYSACPLKLLCACEAGPKLALCGSSVASQRVFYGSCGLLQHLSRCLSKKSRKYLTHD